MLHVILKSYRSKLIIALSIVSVIPVGIMSFMVYRSALDAVYEQASQHHIREMEVFLSQLDTRLGYAELSSFSLLLDKRYTESLAVTAGTSDYKTFDAFNYIRKVNEQMTLANQDVQSVYTYSETGKWITGVDIGYTMKIEDAPYWLERAEIGPAGWRTMNSLSRSPELLICKYFFLKDAKAQHKGVVSVNILFSTLADLFVHYKGNLSGSTILIISEDDDVLYSLNMENAGFETTAMLKLAEEQALQKGYSVLDCNGFSYMLISGQSTRVNLRFTVLESMEELQAPIRQSLWLAVYGMGFMLLFGLIISVMLGRRISAPVITLAEAMQRAEQGDFALLENKNREDEFGILNNGFNNMLVSINKKNKQIILQYEEQKALDLKLMQNQINAHFLYNTLDVIHWIASEYEVDLICKMVSNLSRYYRLSLSEGHDLITLEQVEDLLKSYISIFNIKALDKSWSAAFTVDIPENLREALTLKYIFQPIVENALIHGFPKESGKISLSAEVAENDVLRVTITNTGKEILPDRVRQLNAILQNPANGDSGGSFALKNISRQVKNQCGEDFGMIMTSGDGLTKVIFDLPLRFDN